MASSRHFFATSAVIALAGPIEPNSVAASRMARPISPLIPGFKQVSATIRCLHPITFPRSIGFLLLTLAGSRTPVFTTMTPFLSVTPALRPVRSLGSSARRPHLPLPSAGQRVRPLPLGTHPELNRRDGRGLLCLMNIARRVESIADDLTVSERILLLCIASGTDWQTASRVTAATVAAMVLRGLVERDAAGQLSLSGEGRAAVEVLLKLDD